MDKRIPRFVGRGRTLWLLKGVSITNAAGFPSVNNYKRLPEELGSVCSISISEPAFMATCNADTGFTWFGAPIYRSNLPGISMAYACMALKSDLDMDSERKASTI